MKGEEKANIRRRAAYLEGLANDPEFEKFIEEPLRKMSFNAQKVLEGYKSTEASIRQAQGTISAIRFFHSLFSDAASAYKNLIEKEKR